MARTNYPQAYLDLMREVMGADYDKWMEAQDSPLFRVVRLNPTKLTESAFIDEFPEALRLTEYPGYLYRMPQSETSLGTHPFHHAGCFYIQEPSASLPAVALSIQKGDKVLDVCASPGGKSTQILSMLDSSGFLVSNEIDSKRNQTLRFNLERFGDDNVLVIQNDTAVIGKSFKGYFDKILIDAPCSGMGMYRKDPLGMRFFSTPNIDHCARMQRDILDNIYPALKNNGVLVYSTCTFTKTENELQIAAFMERHPDMILEELPFSIGRPGIWKNHPAMTKCRRITVLEGGEGHFIARMRKSGSESIPRVSVHKPSQNPLIQQTLSSWIDPKISVYEFNNQLYVSRFPIPDAKDIRIKQVGVYLGEIIKGRINLQHAFALSKIARASFVQKQALSRMQTEAYLHGDALEIPYIKGYVLLTYQNQAIGFAKGDGTVLKNHFPKGIRSFQKFSDKSK